MCLPASRKYKTLPCEEGCFSIGLNMVNNLKEQAHISGDLKTLLSLSFTNSAKRATEVEVRDRILSYYRDGSTICVTEAIV